MKVLVANWQDRENPRSGGAEIHLHEVFGRLARRGHEVTLLVSHWGTAPRLAQLDGMAVHRVGSRNTYNAVAPFYYRRAFTSPFDVLIEDLNKVPIFSTLWAREPVGLLVHHLFGRTAFQEASFPFAAATWLLEQPLSLFYGKLPVLAVSESTREDLVARGFRRGQIRVVENGVDITHYRPDPATRRFEQPTLLYLGRLKRYKRVDLVISGFAELAGDIPEARLLIAGTGDYEPELRRLIADLGLGQQVELLGFVSETEKIELLRRSWVHVLTSPKEGWGISNLEAAACGTATVASNSPGLRDSVRHGITGYLVPHGDTASFAQRVGQLLRDQTLRDRLGAQARTFAEGLTWERAADGMETFLADVASNKANLGGK